MSLEGEMTSSLMKVLMTWAKGRPQLHFVRYRLEIGYRTDNTSPTVGQFELLGENLEHISLRDAPKSLRFPHSPSAWRRSILKGRRTTAFISTQKSAEGNRIVRLSQDGKKGMPKSFLAENLPRTVLSTVNGIESPTGLLTRREMQSWRLTNWSHQH